MNKKDLDSITNDKVVDNSVIVRLLEELIINNTLIMSRLKNIEDSILLEQNSLINHISKTKLDISNIISGFPSTDPESHRRYHETQISILEEKRKLRIAIQEKTISGLVWSTIVFLGIAIWNAIKHNIK